MPRYIGNPAIKINTFLNNVLIVLIYIYSGGRLNQYNKDEFSS